MKRVIKEDAIENVKGSIASIEGEEPNDSVDDQIDAFLIKYEASAGAEKQNMMESLQKRNLMFLLEEDETDAAPKVADEPEGSEVQNQNKNLPEKKLTINIDNFTNNVARLVLNAHRILDVESAIINRSRNFIKNNYNKEYVERFDSILDTQYQFNLSGEEDVINVPISVGAAGKSA